MRWFKRMVAVAVLSMTTALAGVGASYGQDKIVRIGFQKYGKLVLLKSKGTLEDKLKAAGYKVVWTEFPSGPPLLEAINVGAIDFIPDGDDLSGDEFLYDDDDAVNYGYQETEEDVERDAPSPYYPGIDVCIVRVMRY